MVPPCLPPTTGVRSPAGPWKRPGLRIKLEGLRPPVIGRLAHHSALAGINTHAAGDHGPPLPTDPPHARASAAADWAAAPQAGGARGTVKQSTARTNHQPRAQMRGREVHGSSLSLAGGASLSPEQPNRCLVLPRRKSKTVGGGNRCL